MGSSSPVPALPSVYTGALTVCDACSDFIAVASGPSISIFDPRLSLVAVLSWKDAFPVGRGRGEVHCVSIDPQTSSIAASSTSHVAVFKTSLTERPSWKVFSSFHIPESAKDIQLRGDRLLIVTQNTISIRILDESKRFPSWKQQSIKKHRNSIHYAKFSKEISHIACYSTSSSIVHIRNNQLHTLSDLSHPFKVRSCSWRGSNTLSTEDSSGCVRLWAPMIDEPSVFVLWTVIPKYSQDHNVTTWLDSPFFPEDTLLHLSSGGPAMLTVVSNINRRPPTLFTHHSYNIDPPILVEANKMSQFENLRCIYYPGGSDATTSSFILLGLNRISTLFARICIVNSFTSCKSILTQPSLFREVSLRPRQFIRSTTRSPRGAFLITVGENSEVSVWKARRKGDQILEMYVFSQQDMHSLLDRPRGFGDSKNGKMLDYKLAIWDGGNRIAAWHGSDIKVLQWSSDGSQNHYQPAVTLKSDANQSSETDIVPLKVLMPITHMRNSSGGEEYYLVAVWATGSIDFWKIKYDDSKQSTIAILLEQFHHDLNASPQAIFALDDALGDVDADAARASVGLVSQSGDLNFWTRNLQSPGWSASGTLETEKTKIISAKASATRKVAILNSNDSGVELSIWDSLTSEFASGLEFSCQFGHGDSPTKLDWTTTPDLHPLLAVGFSTRVIIYVEERMEYYNPETKWVVVTTIMEDARTPIPLSDFGWSWASHIVTASGNQLYLYNREYYLNDNGKLGESTPIDLYSLVSKHIGPLPLYHPQLLLQCLLAGKLSLVNNVLSALQDRLLHKPKDPVELPSISISDFLQERSNSSYGPRKSDPNALEDFGSMRTYNSHYDNESQKKYNPPSNKDFSSSETYSNNLGYDENDDQFSSLLESLDNERVYDLDRTEQLHLKVTAQTMDQIRKQRRALDQNGMRYLISMRSFFLYRGMTEKQHNLSGIPQVHRLRYRDMLWAFHSESQDVLLETSLQAFDNKMSWENAKALNLVLWLRSRQSLETQMEAVARSQYMGDEDRDPVTCSLLYFALRKRKLVQTLWKQAFGHPERAVMLKFLDNDFEQPRWRTAARKNAYALLSKKRFQFAAAFFLLANDLPDAALVCFRQLDDFQLAIAICRLYDTDNGVIFKSILSEHILPLSFTKGWRRLASWTFWMLNRRDLAVKVLLTPFSEMTSTLPKNVEVQPATSYYDDPSLALVYLQLRRYSVQAARGAEEISESQEFIFVLHIANILRRMGCHLLALDLVRSWPFRELKLSRPSPDKSPIQTPVKSESNAGRSDKEFARKLKRRSTLNHSMRLDEDVIKEIRAEADNRKAQNVGGSSPQEDQKDEDEVTAEQPNDDKIKANFAGEKKIVSSEPQFDMSSFGF